MASHIDIDVSQVQAGLKKLTEQIAQASARALFQVGQELLRLSTYEVPHDTGMLQASASTEIISPEEIAIGYNKVYAAYQHEGGDGKRIIRNYQKGRKSHYLTDPLEKNTHVFEDWFTKELGNVLR